MPNKAIFFDRDGTLNVDVHYLHEPADFVWVEGAIEAIRWANEHGYLVIVVTNQSGIARGYYDEAAVHRLHDWMNEELARQGARIDAFYYCPHHPAGRVPAYTRICDCRKPAPGMLLRAMAACAMWAGASRTACGRQSRRSRESKVRRAYAIYSCNIVSKGIVYDKEIHDETQSIRTDSRKK